MFNTGLTHRGVDKDPNFVCDVTRGKLQGTRDTVTADVKLRTEVVIIKHRHSHCRPVDVAGVVLKPGDHGNRMTGLNQVNM